MPSNGFINIVGPYMTVDFIYYIPLRFECNWNFSLFLYMKLILFLHKNKVRRLVRQSKRKNFQMCQRKLKSFWIKYIRVIFENFSKTDYSVTVRHIPNLFLMLRVIIFRKLRIK